MKQYQFNYFYQQSKDDNNQLNYLKQVDTSAKYRLFLNSIKEVNNYGESLLPYKFEYNSVPLPNRFSNSQDNWGYYNGKNNGSYLTFYDNGTPNDREVDTAYSGAGLLQRITYPTGGSTHFIFEQNRIKPPQFIDHLLYNRNNPTEISVKGDAFYKDSMYYTNGMYSKIITIGSDLLPGSDVEFSFVPPFVPPGADSSIIFYQVKLQNLDSNSVIYLYPPDTRRDIDIAPGTYRLMAIPTGANDPNNPNRAFIAGLRWTILDQNADSLQNGEWYGAGKRIKKIETWNANNLVSEKEYEYLNDSLKTSGKMIGLPNYYWKNKNVPELGPIVEGYGAMPYSPLSQIQGNSLGYSQVTAYLGTKSLNQGKTIFKYTDFADGGEYYRMPYPLPIDYEWLRGKPLLTKIYKKNGGSYDLQKSIENSYLYAGVYTSENIFSQPFLHADSNIYKYLKNRDLFYLPLFTFAPCDVFNINSPPCFKIYYQSGGRVDLTGSTEKIYNNGQILTNITKFGYNLQKHYQPTFQKTWTSKGDTIIATTTYPPDLGSKTTAEQKLIDSNRIATPIIMEIIAKNSSNIQLSKTLRNIINKDWGNNFVLPEIMQTAINNEPLTTDATYNKYDRFGAPLK